MALSIGGLGSGLDTAGIVAQLMATERIPQAKIQAQGAAAQRQVGAWNELRTKVQSLLSASEALRTPAKAVTPAATSSSPAVRVTAGESAATGQSAFFVRRLASAEQRTWDSVGPASMTVGAGRSVLASGKLGAQNAAAALDLSGASAGVHAVTVTRGSSAATAYGTAATTLSATDLSVTLADGSTRAATLSSSYADADALKADLQAQLGSDLLVDLVGGRLRIRTEDEGAGQSLAFGGGAASALGLPTGAVQGQNALVTVDGKRVEVVPQPAGAGSTDLELGDSGIVLRVGASVGTGTIKVNVIETDADDTLTDLASKLSASGSPVTGALLTNPDGTSSLVTTATSTGLDGAVTELVKGHALFDRVPTKVDPVQAQLQVGGALLANGDPDPANPGRAFSYSSNTITDLVPGVTFELLYKPPVGPSGAYDPVATSVSRDSSGTKDKVKALVDAMNGLLTDVKTKTAYDVATRSGGPLTGNGVARSLSSSVFSRAAAFSPSGEVRTLSQLGISTTRDGGFALDAAALTKALEASPDDVARVLSSAADNLAVWAKETSRTGGVLTTQRDGADAEVQNRRKQVEAMETRLTRVEERYRKQFAALETAMASLNSQRSAMTSALGTLGV